LGTGCRGSVVVKGFRGEWIHPDEVRARRAPFLERAERSRQAELVERGLGGRWKEVEVRLSGKELMDVSEVG
jgi:hypothetical protein